MFKRSSLVFALLCVLYALTLASPEARAVGTISNLSFSDGDLSGYSATWVDWSDGYDECTDWEYDWDNELYYCATEVYGIPWGSLYGTLNSPSGMFSTDSTWDYYYAEIDYSESPEIFGTWEAVGDHYLGEDNYIVYCYDEDGDCDPDEALGPSWEELAGTSAFASVLPQISATGTTIWDFAGESPSGYPLSVTLTSSGGEGTTWTVTQGSNEVHLSATSGASITVTSSATALSQHFSATAGDVHIVATAGGVNSNPALLTTLTPTYWTHFGTDTTTCYYGYETYVYYYIQDNLSNPLPSTVDVNEYWASGGVQDLTPWPDPAHPWVQTSQYGGVTLSGSQVYDRIQGQAGVTQTPTPDCNGASTATIHWTQQWFLGTQTIGHGKVMATDTFQKYVNHGAHLPPM